MTEVPEHLLKRSHDRRAALGLGGDDGGGGDDAPPPRRPPRAPDGGGRRDAHRCRSRRRGHAAPSPPSPSRSRPTSKPPCGRKKIPVWAMPVLAFLPVWAIIYLGGLSKASTGEPTQLEQGATIFAAQCAVLPRGRRWRRRRSPA